MLFKILINDVNHISYEISRWNSVIKQQTREMHRKFRTSFRLISANTKSECNDRASCQHRVVWNIAMMTVLLNAASWQNVILISAHSFVWNIVYEWLFQLVRFRLARLIASIMKRVHVRTSQLKRCRGVSMHTRESEITIWSSRRQMKKKPQHHAQQEIMYGRNNSIGSLCSLRLWMHKIILSRTMILLFYLWTFLKRELTDLYRTSNYCTIKIFRKKK